MELEKTFRSQPSEEGNEALQAIDNDLEAIARVLAARHTCYFTEGHALYHASGEDRSDMFFRFKRLQGVTKVLLELKGARIHYGFYSEVGPHTHDPGTLATSDPGNHQHGNESAHTHDEGSLSGSQPPHIHGLSGSTGVQSTNHTHDVQNRYHRHGVDIGAVPDFTGYEYSCDQATTGVSADHTHPAGTLAAGAGGDDAVAISGSTGAGSAHDHPPAGAHTHTFTGATAANTPAYKSYPDQLKVYVNGVDKTTEVLAKTALTQLGNGLSSHAFVTTGTGEMDITDLVESIGFHELRITEPISAKGGRVLLHLEVY